MWVVGNLIDHESWKKYLATRPMADNRIVWHSPNGEKTPIGYRSHLRKGHCDSLEAWTVTCWLRCVCSRTSKWSWDIAAISAACIRCQYMCMLSLVGMSLQQQRVEVRREIVSPMWWWKCELRLCIGSHCRRRRTRSCITAPTRGVSKNLRRLFEGRCKWEYPHPSSANKRNSLPSDPKFLPPTTIIRVDKCHRRAGNCCTCKNNIAKPRKRAIMIKLQQYLLCSGIHAGGNCGSNYYRFRKVHVGKHNATNILSWNTFRIHNFYIRARVTS